LLLLLHAAIEHLGVVLLLPMAMQRHTVMRVGLEVSVVWATTGMMSVTFLKDHVRAEYDNIDDGVEFQPPLARPGALVEDELETALR
jgi:hypothetical protein